MDKPMKLNLKDDYNRVYSLKRNISYANKNGRVNCESPWFQKNDRGYEHFKKPVASSINNKHKFRDGHSFYDEFSNKFKEF
jgi:hypothetical protein